MDHLLRKRQGVDTAQLRADAAAYGVILEPHHLEPVSYGLWAEHLPAVELLARCITQWRAGSNGVIGLDYGVVLKMARLYGTPDLPRVMEDLQLMEFHARELINKQSTR